MIRLDVSTWVDVEVPGQGDEPGMLARAGIVEGARCSTRANNSVRGYAVGRHLNATLQVAIGAATRLQHSASKFSMAPFAAVRRAHQRQMPVSQAEAIRETAPHRGESLEGFE